MVASDWVLDLYARDFFEELHVKWSVGTKISGVGAEAALKNRSAQDLFGERLVGRKSTFASGRLLGRECRKLFARVFGGELQMKRSFAEAFFSRGVDEAALKNRSA